MLVSQPADCALPSLSLPARVLQQRRRHVDEHRGIHESLIAGSISAFGESAVSKCEPRRTRLHRFAACTDADGPVIGTLQLVFVDDEGAR
jgi:hypothetical protein